MGLFIWGSWLCECVCNVTHLVFVSAIIFSQFWSSKSPDSYGNPLISEAEKQVGFSSSLERSPLAHLTASFVAPSAQLHSCQNKVRKHWNFLVQAETHTKWLNWICPSFCHFILSQMFCREVVLWQTIVLFLFVCFLSIRCFIKFVLMLQWLHRLLLSVSNCLKD